MRKINTVDLFAGCGGLTEGFAQTGLFRMISGVEWDKAPVECLRFRMKTRWGVSDADERILRFDMQRTDELINGWNDDPEYGSSKGLAYYVNESGEKLDLRDPGLVTPVKFQNPFGTGSQVARNGDSVFTLVTCFTVLDKGAGIHIAHPVRHGGHKPAGTAGTECHAGLFHYFLHRNAHRFL